MGERRHGGLDFADLRDETGAIQLIVARDVVGAEALHDFSDLDLGDWVGVEGEVDRLRARRAVGRAGELRAAVEEPAPAARTSATALTDPETRYRQRYLDLILDEPSRRVFASARR